MSAAVDRAEVLRLLRAHDEAQGEQRFRGFGSAGSDYLDALNLGLITREQYDTARASYGPLWNYAGD